MTFKSTQGDNGQKKSYSTNPPKKEIRTFELRASEDNFAEMRIKESTLKGWIQNGISPEAVSFADHFGKFLKAGMTTSQIRNVFGELRRIQMNGFTGKERTSFLLLKPKLAYTVKRFKAKERDPLFKFYDLFSIGFEAVNSTGEDRRADAFENFMQLMEAVLAYHRFHGGKE
jgi:CRISPR-associated protein Csm2